jgi:hypothetical protein
MERLLDDGEIRPEIQAVLKQAREREWSIGRHDEGRDREPAGDPVATISRLCIEGTAWSSHAVSPIAVATIADPWAGGRSGEIPGGKRGGDWSGVGAGSEGAFQELPATL